MTVLVPVVEELELEDVVTVLVTAVASRIVPVTAAVPVPSEVEVVTTGVPDDVVVVPSDQVVVVTGVVVVVVVVTGIVVTTVST